MKVRYVLITVAILYIMAFSVRLVPLATSHIPYNTDSLLEARMSQDIANSGGLVYPDNASYINERHSTVTPFYNLFLALTSVITGIQTIVFMPVLIPLLTSITIIAIFLIVMKMTKNKFAALGSGVFLALSGTYVTVSLAPWKESFGLILLPVIFYLYINREEDPRLRGIAIFLLAFLPIIHHLVTAVAYLVITFITLIPLIQRLLRRRLTRNDKLDLGTLGSLWLLAFGYYYVSKFNRMEFFKPDSGLWLFLSVFSIMLLIALYAVRRTPTKMYMIILPPLLTLGIFVVNFFIPVFPYTVGTNKTLMLYILPYLLLIYPILVGFAIVLDSDSKYRVFLIALFTGPFTILLFAFLWGFNPTTSYPMIVRTYDFLDIGIAVAVGIGIAYLINRLRSKNARAVFGVLFVATIFATTSIAYSTQKVFEIQNSTYEYEVDVLQWVKEKNHAGTNISTDRRIWEIGHNIYDLDGDFGLPYVMKNQVLQRGRVCIIETQWTRSPGAQMYPLDSVIISSTDLNERSGLIMTNNNLLASAGPSDNLMLVMMRP